MVLASHVHLDFFVCAVTFARFSGVNAVTTYGGYQHTDPTAYDQAFGAQAEFDSKRSMQECFCGQSRHKSLWLGVHQQLHSGFAADSSFTGDWVHSLCGKVYPVIFKVVSVDLGDDSFMMHSDCPGGLVAMLAVCAQSAALQQLQARTQGATHLASDDRMVPAISAAAAHEGVNKVTIEEGASSSAEHRDVQLPPRVSGRWWRTPRVVLSEGTGIKDVFGVVPLERCLALCEDQPECQSLSHGPFGCHLKSRCIGMDEPVVPVGEQGEDYQTYYRENCREKHRKDGDEDLSKPMEMAAATVKEGEALEAVTAPTESMQTMIRFMLRALEFCFHCLDASPWPFLVGEVLENYALATETPHEFLWHRAAGRLVGPSTNLGTAEDAMGGPNAPSLDPPTGMGVPLSTIRMTLLRLHVRWIRGLEMEAAFWRGKLSSDVVENNSIERLRKWLATGEVQWFLEQDNMCGVLLDALHRRGSNYISSLPRILNAGSGPFAPQPLHCSVPAKWLPKGRKVDESVPWPVEVHAADGLARLYLRVMDEQGYTPLYRPMQCPVEELHTCFPPSYFDVVHMRNALDHVFDPVLGLVRMLHVVRPGGWVLLRHARNEGVPGKFRNGLHQWAFDAEPRDDVAGVTAGDFGLNASQAFVIWNPELRIDVTNHLLGTGLAAEVNTRLLDHPSSDAPADEKYVWVDIRRPTDAEAAQHFSTLAQEAVAV